jgi:hypothetical protein
MRCPFRGFDAKLGQNDFRALSEHACFRARADLPYLR